MKSLSVSIMLLEYSFGKLKYGSTTLPMSGFLGSSPVSASKSPVSLAILNFQRNSMFLYSLLKSAANAVLKLTFAVIAIAHVPFVSIKDLRNRT